MSVSAERSTLILSDGRSLDYLECGAPDGAPVLHHHGGLMSAGDILPCETAANEAGIRLIAFDRPGIAGSSPLPGRTVLDGAHDAEQLLDHLGIGSVRLMGWSMGGQYALASAYRLGDRVQRTALVGGCLPLDDPVTLAEINAMDRRFTEMADEHAARLRAAAAVLGGLSRFSPHAWAIMAAQGEGAADEAAVHAADDALASAAHEATAQHAGVVEEYRVWVRPWGFGLSDVTGSVDVWQGTEDHLVPAAWPQRLASGLPRSALHLVAGVGHFLLLTRARDVFSTLTATD